MSCGSCDGRCCAVFTFPRTPEQIRKILDRGERYNGDDGPMIADMLVPLTPKEALERMRRFGVKPQIGGEALTPRQWLKRVHNHGHVYTCRHWDENSRLCTVYDKRPTMCRDYPYTETCQHGCGWELPAPDLKVYITKMEAWEKKRKARDSNPKDT